LAEIFPGARAARMDTDSVRKKGQAFRILKKFSSRQIDILVGTQMITKGYDFPGVTLVGIVSADLSLGFPDFRGGERTFQILSQVAGRAGRGKNPGRVLIQTFNPEHYAVKMAVAHDYKSFFRNEIALRKQLVYPPFSHLACLRLHGKSKEITERTVEEMSGILRDKLKSWPRGGKDIQVLGPAEAPISRMKGKYRWQILLKSKDPVILHKLLGEIYELSRKIKVSRDFEDRVNINLDVDPYNMI
jgi:primosomal protein N' (replication factor Y)